MMTDAMAILIAATMAALVGYALWLLTGNVV